MDSPQSRLAKPYTLPRPKRSARRREQDERAHDQSGNHHHGERFRAGHIHILHEIGDHEHRKDVEEHVVDPARAHAERDIAGMLLTDAYDGQALVFGLAAFLRLAEVGGFKDMHTDIEATPTRTTLSRNAQRQPHAMNCSFVSPTTGAPPRRRRGTSPWQGPWGILA